MNRMKSAFELAMERAMGLEEPDEGQKLEWELGPKGRRLAGLSRRVDAMESFARRNFR